MKRSKEEWRKTRGKGQVRIDRLGKKNENSVQEGRGDALVGYFWEVRPVLRTHSWKKKECHLGRKANMDIKND